LIPKKFKEIKPQNGASFDSENFQKPKINLVTKSRNCPTLKAGELVSSIINPKP
jgi:hypothetical protein